MAISGTTQWDCRTSGSNSNGGGFDTSATGTDYSQQDSAQFAYTDIVINGTTNTHITSAAHPFDSTSPGNIINITSGTGFTVQRIQIVSVASGVATCDKAVGTLGSTGGTGNLGGALIDVSTAVAAIGTTGNTVHVKSGTYTYTAQTTWQSSFTGNKYSVTGYTTTHGDGAPTRPLITTATNSVNLVGIQSNNTWVNISNINFSNTAGTPGAGIFSSNGSNFPSFNLSKCKLSGFTNGIASTNSYGGLVASEVEVTGTTSNGMQTTSNTTVVSITHCNFHDNTGVTGLSIASAPTSVTIIGSLFTKNPIGINMAGASSVLMVNNTFADNTSDGVKTPVPNSLVLSNNIFYGNGGYGVNITTTGIIIYFLETNAYGSNTSGNTNNLTVSSSAVTLTANPFVNDSISNFALDSTSGGGAACQRTASPGTFPGGTTTGYLDLGASQTSGAPGTGGANYGFVA